MDSKTIGKIRNFPGCCGVDSIKDLNPKVTKAQFTSWLKDQNCAGGLVTAVSKVKDKAKEKALKDFGFKLLITAKNENIWYRRLRFGANW